MKKILLVVLILTSFLRGLTANKYVSTGGNDANPGTQSLPYKTIQKVNSIFSTLNPGDSVLFNRGDTFYGTLTISKSGTLSLPIVIGAYGSSGAKPIFTSLISITGWVNMGGNVWQSSANPTLGDHLNYILKDGEIQQIGRYPNSDASNGGYLVYESSSSNSITDNQLLNTPNWTGAEVVVRNKAYQVNRRTILLHTGTLIRVTQNFTSVPTPLFGYFIQNSLQTLDQVGEWYFNPSTKKISIYSLSAPTGIQAPALSYLVRSTNFNYVTLSNINASGANDTAFYIGLPNPQAGGSGFKIKNCDVSFASEGILLSRHPSFLVENSSVTNCLNNGIKSIDNGTSTISNNFIYKIYQLAGMGYDGGNAIDCKGATLVEYNTIRRTGYAGITFDGSNTVIQYNFCDSGVTVKNDGGLIYTQGAVERFGQVIRGNIVLNAIGAGIGTDAPSLRQAQGIYIDNHASNILIEGNTAAFCEFGIFLHRGHDNIVTNNTFYNNLRQFYVNANNNNEPIRNIIVKKNIYFAATATQKTATWITVGNDVGLMASIMDSNVYARPIAPGNTITNQGSVISLPMWRTAFPQYDLHSTVATTTITNTSQLLFVYNNTAANKDTSLGSGSYVDVYGTGYSGTITLLPFTSKVLINTGTLIVPTITWANPSAITYPTALSGTQLNATSGGVPGTFTYTPASGTVLNGGAGQTLSVVFTPTNQAAYSTASKSVTITVNKASATLSFSNLSRPYTGLPLAPTVTTSPAGLSGITILYDNVGQTPTNAGSRSVVAGLTNQNYAATSISNTFTITKLTPTITWPSIVDITYGTALSGVQLNATASVPGVLTYSPVIGTVLNAGLGQTLSVNFIPTDATNYNSVLNTTRSINVNKATATISLTNLNQIADGSPKTVTVTTSPAGLATTTTYTPSTVVAPNTYAVNTTLDATTNYTASPASANLVLSASTSSIAITNLLQTYTGSPLPVTVTTNPVAAYTVTYNASATVPSLVGSYQVIATKNDLSAADTQTLVIQKSTAILLLSNLTYTYDGFPHSATITTVPAGLSGTSITYNLSPTAPTNANSYAAEGSLSNANYQATNVSGTLIISKANPVITWEQPQSIPEGTGLTSIQLNATADISGSLVYSPNFGDVPIAGTQLLTVIFTPTDSSNYNTISKSVPISIYGSSPILDFFIRRGNILYIEQQ